MSLDVYLFMEVDTGGPEPRIFDLYSANYTHNCNTMAEAAGIYNCIWHPDKSNITTAKDLIEPLQKGIEAMENDPETYIALNPVNGWGSYDTFLPWVKNYLQACIENPKASIKVSR